MADYTYNLSVPEFHENPVRVIITPTLSGTDNVYIKSPDVLGIPQIFDLVSIYLTLTTDPTVANRNIKFIKRVSGINTIGGQSANIAASSTGSLSLARYASAPTSGQTYSPTIGINPRFITIGNLVDLWAFIGTGKAGDTYQMVAELIYLNRVMGLPEVLNRR